MSVSSCHTTKLTIAKFPQSLSASFQVKRKRTQESESESPPLSKPAEKRPRISPTGAAATNTFSQSTIDGVTINPIEYWIEKERWPKAYIESEMDPPLAKKKSSPSLRRTQSEVS